MIREAVQSPPPPPPPPAGQPPMMPAGGPAPMAVPGNLASPGLRIVGGLIDVVLLAIVIGIVEGITRGTHGASGLVGLIVALAYFGYFWSSRGQTIGMMVFGFRVRDQATGQYPSVGKAILRGFIWWLEVGFTFCLIGAVGWLWQLWDPQRQAIHDKIAGTVVTAN
jgi:uncharacterized RDD family membrane protein YckC